MMILKSGRISFHAKRVGFALLRMALYSCICGVFFMVGMELGRIEMQRQHPFLNNFNASQLLGGNDDYGDPEWTDGEPGMNQVGPGLLPFPNHMKPGEMGKPYKPSKLNEAQKKKMKDGWQKNAINQYVSDLISVERSLPDVRHPKCKEPDRYLRNLPRASVIICFHNEAWSILLRSVHSVLNRSPAELLKEVILVDDCSTQDHLKNQLDQYMSKYPKVRIIRATKRVGLIQARMMGARVAKGKVLTFLDSHIEATPGWLPPLLDRIGRNMTNVVCPVIDVIDDDTLEYNYDKGPPEAIVHSVGIFDWSMTFNWMAMPERERLLHNDTSEPFATPTMAGGLFAISKRYFERLGMYDPEFDIWGGENLELSFKTWMCGGRLEIVPCSHVGHIFRHRSPYKWREGVNSLKKNLVRLAKVWTDEYGKYYFDRLNNELGEYGDISERVELRRRLKCRSFKWYIQNVYPEVFIPDKGYAYGEIRNLGGSKTMCLDSPMEPKDPKSKVIVFPCHGQGGNQYFSYTQNLEIRRDEACVDYAGDKVIQFPCHGGKGNQEWNYNQKTKLIVHGVYQKCLTMVPPDKVDVLACNKDDANQRWEMQNYKEILTNSEETEG